jgi:hypothetical protein
MAADGQSACENLEILDLAVGQPETTCCGVWETRYHKMPIKMLRWDGTLAYESHCVIFDKHLDETGNITLPKTCSIKLVQIEI